MIEVVATLTSLVSSALCFAWACATYHPSSSCPVGWWIPEGVRRTGEFTCRPAPRGQTERNARGILVDHSTQPAGAISGHVVCGGSSVPVIEVDGRTVSCR